MDEPNARPLLAYDGECGFCKAWIARWEPDLRDRVALRPYQEIAGEHPEIPAEEFARAIHYFDRDGRVYRGAEAVLRALAQVPEKRWMLWLYQHVPGWRPAAEALYRVIARERGLAARIVRASVGPDLSRPTYATTCRWFLRLLACAYLVAFGSLWSQVAGLFGTHGILPAAELLERGYAALGPRAWLARPTILSWNASDPALHALCAGGVALSLLLACGLVPRIALALLWLAYLSLVSVGDVFLGYQWDVLLLETGFLAILFAPGRRGAPPSRVGLFLLRWLLFRLVFMSGVVKLESGDATWADWTALEYHYWTQPLPHRLSVFANELPGWFQRASAAGMFAIELGAPWLIFAPRRLRYLGCASIVFLMLLISGTGNYGFFTLLGLTLCTTLLDDGALAKLSPRRLRSATPALGTTPKRSGLRRAIACVFAVGVFAWTLTLMALRLGWIERPPAIAIAVQERVGPFRTFNNYGLFAVMTTERREIVVEGSADGERWLAYEFRWKPTETSRPPRWAAVHMPRLDWQMWFAALGEWRRPRDRWYLAFVQHLLEGAEPVLALLEKNPFPDAPPRYVRSTVYRYRFAPADQRAEGTWWTRELVGPYCPTLELRDGQLNEKR